MALSKISTLWLFGLFTVLGTTGCFVQDDDDSGIVLDWGLQYVGGGDVNCAAAGAKRVDVDLLNVRTNRDTHFMFPCEAGSGQIPDVEPGEYSVGLRLRDPDGKLISEIGGTADVLRGNITDLGVTFFTIQSFRLSWGTLKAGNPARCLEVGAEKVELVAQVANDTLRFAFDCAQGQGTTTAIGTGTYTYQVRLLGPGGAEIQKTASKLITVGGERRADLESVLFDVK